MVKLLLYLYSEVFLEYAGEGFIWNLNGFLDFVVLSYCKRAVCEADISVFRAHVYDQRSGEDGMLVF